MRDRAIIAGAVVILLAIAGNAYLGLHAQASIRHDEVVHAKEARYTRVVQEAGEPTGVCLREAMKAGLPVLITVADDIEAALKKAKSPPPASALTEVNVFLHLTRLVEAPLKEYVQLQEHRYAGVRCPTPPREQ